MLRPLSRYSRNMRLLRALMPENPAANLLLQWAQQGEQFGRSTHTYGLLAAIVLGAEPRSAGPAAFLAPARHFRDYNQVHFRTGWGPEDMSVFLAARWHHGHVHDDVGLFTLWSHGRFWASDPGTGIAETEAHNLVLVDGRGQPRRSAGGDIQQFVHSSLASLAGADATRAWQRQLVGHYDWLTAPVVDTMMRARRVVAVLWPDTALGVKPCLLVLDRMQKDTEQRKYDWILNTWPDHQIRLRGSRATLGCPFDRRYFAGLDRVLDDADSKEHYIQFTVQVPADGRYNVWAFGRGAKDWTGAAVDVWLDRQKVGYAPVDGPVWHWRKLSRTESDVLSAGQNVTCLLYTSPSPRDATLSRMPSSA